MIIIDKHLQDFENSCITKKEAAKAGYESTTITINGIEEKCWSINYRNPFTKQTIATRYRLDNPEDPKRKYHQVKGTRVCPYFSQQITDSKWLEMSARDGVKIILAEGEKKTDCLIKHLLKDDLNYLPVGLSGVWNWSNGNKEIHDLIDRFILPSREFYLLIDSDYKTNPSVKQAALTLASSLIEKGVKVFLIIVPGDGGGDSKLGIDDYLYAVEPETRPKMLLDLLEQRKQKLTKSLIKQELTKVSKQLKEKALAQTVFSLAQGNLPEETVGQMVFKSLFKGGADIVTINGKLHEYDCELGYFKELSDDYLKKIIADDLDKNASTLNLGRISNFNEALEYVKVKSQILSTEVNPPGINVENGYLKLSYQEGKPRFELLNHSKKNYFTYTARCIYDPNADVEFVRNILLEMINEDDLKVLLKTIASQFDISSIRKRVGRIRALLLWGDGSNGKDTIQEWINLLLREGLTKVGLIAFRQADQGRTFQLVSLVNSIINWPSENKPISIDKCQSLKNCITGEEIQIEDKGKPPFKLKCNTIFLFNINDCPHLEANQEAILSRYYVIKFPNIFKRNPDTSNSFEKQANPSYKEDHKFIKEKILPGFLNLLIEAYELVFEEGIDYSGGEKLLKEIREEGSHLIRFINETGLEECSEQKGTTVSEIYKHYEKWCTEEGYIELNDSYDRKSRKFYHPNEYDRIISTAADMGKRLKKIYPKLAKSRVSNRRSIGLNFNDSISPF